MDNTEMMTKFKVTSECNGREREMEFAIPVALSETDWQEIARMLRAAMVTLSKLPVDKALPIIDNVNE